MKILRPLRPVLNLNLQYASRDQLIHEITFLIDQLMADTYSSHANSAETDFTMIFEESNWNSWGFKVERENVHQIKGHSFEYTLVCQELSRIFHDIKLYDFDDTNENLQASFEKLNADGKYSIHFDDTTENDGIQISLDVELIPEKAGRYDYCMNLDVSFFAERVLDDEIINKLRLQSHMSEEESERLYCDNLEEFARMKGDFVQFNEKLIRVIKTGSRVLIGISNQRDE